jgi:putative transposase
MRPSDALNSCAPNRVWLAEITYETDQGWLYLATVMDLYSRRIFGWSMANTYL